MAKNGFDEAAVVAAYERLQNFHAVAREIGVVHHNTVKQIVRRHQNKCPRCGSADILPGVIQCQSCRDGDRKRMKEARRSRRWKGLCVQCGGPVSPPSHTLCEAHRIAAAARNVTYDARVRQRGAAQGSAPSLAQKLYAIRQKYGQGGIDCFNDAHGCCEVCGASYDEVAVHIHHIDEDPSNNVRENFACLCFDDHKLVHSLLAAKNRSKALEWFRRTYPDRPLAGIR